jgi:DNA-binding beta-propeller fold protein YncE
MKRTALLVAASVTIVLPAASSTSASPGASYGRIAGARALRACAAAGPYWPTMTLALAGKAAWVACKEQSRLVRLALPSGRQTGGVRLDAPVTAVAVGPGSVWALDANSTLYRLDTGTGRVRRRIQLDAIAAYNIWIGGGAVWVADDQGASVLRIAPSTNKVVAHIRVGDGPADMAFFGTQAWVVTHRDNTIFHIDLATNAATRLATLGGGNVAVERLALLGGSLWATGRGAPLFELDSATGATSRSVDIGGTGIDVVATAGALWVPVRTAAVDRTGFPTMTAVRRVNPDGTVTTVAKARGRVDVHGLAAGLGAVWLADNTNGVVYQLPT